MKKFSSSIWQYGERKELNSVKQFMSIISQWIASNPYSIKREHVVTIAKAERNIRLPSPMGYSYQSDRHSLIQPPIPCASLRCCMYCMYIDTRNREMDIDIDKEIDTDGRYSIPSLPKSAGSS